MNILYQPKSAVLYANRSAASLKAGNIDEAIADGLRATEVRSVQWCVPQQQELIAHTWQLDEQWGKGWYRYAEALDAQEPRNAYLVAETCESKVIESHIIFDESRDCV